MKTLWLSLSLLLVLLSTMVTTWLLVPGKVTDAHFGAQDRDSIKESSQSKTSNFTCESRPPGFYADVLNSCRRFHVCNEKGDVTQAFCPYPTLFDQRQRICTDEEVPCEQSEKWYYLDSTNYYSYFMESKRKADVVLEEIDVYTVIPLEDDKL